MPAFDPGNLKSHQPPGSLSAPGGEPASLTDSRLFEATQDQSAQELEHARRTSATPPAEVAGYEMEGFLGAGAYGSVWKARQKSTGKRVAIKFYEHRGGLDWTFLSREVEKLAFLYTDRDVVQLIDVGWDASPPYYVMEYLERGSLDQLMSRGRVPVAEAVRIVREVGQALVHAHGRGILHCDLKPANVLLDNDWKVRLADFGQSRLSHEQVPALGTLFYMAPEQADLKAAPDARWDVYALGSLLFHLLTGHPPHRTPEVEARLKQTPKLSERLAEYQRVIKSAPPLTVHRRVRGVDRSLAEIVERCLEADPAQRFPNAQAVIEAMDRRARQRARRPLMWLGGVAPVVLLGFTILLGYVGWSSTVGRSTEDRVRQARATNQFAAKGQASIVLREFDRLSHLVRRVAEEIPKSKALCDYLSQHQDIELDPATIGDLQTNEANVARTFLEATRDRFDAPFETWVLFNTKGTFVARAPIDVGLVGNKYHWRDYYRGLMERLGDQDEDPVYISRVFRSQAEEQYYMFGMSTPARDGEGRLLGVLMATIITNSLPLDLGDESRLMTVLIARWDDNRPPGGPNDGSDPVPTQARETDADSQPDYQIFVHPLYPQVGNKVVDAMRINAEQRALIERLGTTDSGASVGPEEGLYTDPVAELYADNVGKWLPGLQPVGETPFLVFVQEPYKNVIEPVNALASELAWLGWKALGLGIILLVVAWYFVVRAMQRDTGEIFRDPAGSPAESPTVTETWSTSSASGGGAA